MQSLPEIERKLDARLARVEAQLDALPLAVERLYPELVGNREAAEMVPSLIEAVRLDVERIFAELVEVRQTVEPLQGPAERLERMSDRLPGGG